MKTLNTAKIINDKSGQIIMIPKNYRIQGDKVRIEKLGELVFLIPVKKNKKNFLGSL